MNLPVVVILTRSPAVIDRRYSPEDVLSN